MEILMFPGQGSQHPGMGKDVFERYPTQCQDAEAVLGYSLAELCLQDREGRLNQTAYTQPALYFVCCLTYLDHLSQAGRSFHDSHDGCLLGHSLGLFPALFAAGVFDLMTGLRIVARRGELMQAIRGGGMLAVLGASADRLREKLIQLDCFDVDVANDNAPGQVVLSGREERMRQLSPLLEKEGLRCVPLPVSGAFHSRYMEPCRVQFADFLRGLDLKAPQKTVISSTSGDPIGGEHLVEEMAFQLVKPVRWSLTIQSLLRRYPQARFVELGPGRVLTNLQGKIQHAVATPAQA
ncbi:acyltransferase domain-containing protein [Hahella sp. KA22]|uniref:ACP S-malonyltransferase n=1 Tax=Hahella sp. KA22 TaxID=1628392 RepID=UPI000FDD249A|nr:acyltransferase domain-containing protein [Hahella sp. KA22]AZZ92535.1 acyltransferase domain-containing protein [Hahella sp. KA22]QAY55908.1 acyltransferase domain-containing protein [Hahella sp. KA22]